MNIGDRVKLKVNLYYISGVTDDKMAPGKLGIIISKLGGDCYIVYLDDEVEGKRDWSFIAKELEVVV